MSSNRLNKLLLICTLCLSLAATGCSAQWISVALADLPVLTQMALNIATLVSNVHTGEQIDTSETAAIQNICLVGEICGSPIRSNGRRKLGSRAREPDVG